MAVPFLDFGQSGECSETKKSRNIIMLRDILDADSNSVGVQPCAATRSACDCSLFNADR
jgi:hypothetical protein